MGQDRIVFHAHRAIQFVVFKLLICCFEETRFDVRASFTRRPVSHIIKPGDTTKGYSNPRDFS